jgi:hypothetical protein
MAFSPRALALDANEGTGGGETGPFAPTRQNTEGGAIRPCRPVHDGAGTGISQTAVTDLCYL